MVLYLPLKLSFTEDGLTVETGLTETSFTLMMNFYNIHEKKIVSIGIPSLGKNMIYLGYSL